MIPDVPVRIGRPVPGWACAVVDSENQPVKWGETGELIVAGVGLGRYLDPVKDAECYTEFPALGWERGYRTGDLVRAEQEAVTVGPYVDESFSPCLACACADEPEIGPRPEPVRHDIIVGLAARAVAALIARATVTHLPGDARRTDLATFTYSDRPVVSRPGCPICSVAGAGEEPVPVAPSAPVGARYEQSVAIPPAAFVDSKGHQQHYKPSNLRLQREFRDWPVCPRTPLPPVDLERLDQPWPVVHPLADDGNEPIVVRQYTGMFQNLIRTLTLLDGNGNTTFPGHVTAQAFHGNADSASRLEGHSLAQIQAMATKVAVLSGTIAHGATIPLPEGYTEEQCKWMVSMTYPWTEYKGMRGYVTCYTEGRTVICAYHWYNNYSKSWMFNGGVNANYIVIGVK